ncbi:MAG: NfeD family protein [Proteiniphilum sp.]|nr:NfeD family protein [Proteiniphilum sp.]MDD4800027.1 NfeD family protein [Proteiniphilum sp.]
MALDLLIVVALILLGIFFMLVEIFLLPGISIAGFAGAVCLIGGIVYAFLFLGSTAGNITLAASAAAMGGTFFWLLKSKSLRKISLETHIDSHVDCSDLMKITVGDTGIALSRLNPIGRVMVNEVSVEGKSFNGEFIDEDEEIEVVRVESCHILVKRLEAPGSNPIQHDT